jgi:hypothetical protein
VGQAEDDIRAAVAAYNSVFPSVKPKITLSVFGDSAIQLFLHAPDSPRYLHAQGDGKTLEEAAVALKAHLGRRLTEYRIEAEKELAAYTAGHTTIIERCLSACGSIQPPTETSTSEPPKE